MVWSRWIGLLLTFKELPNLTLLFIVPSCEQRFDAAALYHVSLFSRCLQTYWFLG
jgi:hypothetical protein